MVFESEQERRSMLVENLDMAVHQQADDLGLTLETTDTEEFADHPDGDLQRVATSIYEDAMGTKYAITIEALAEE